MRLLGLLLVLFAIACSNSNAGTDAGGGDTLSPDERAGFDVGAPSVPAYVQLVAITDRMFNFDPTLDTTKNALQNAQAIDAQLTSELGANGDGGTKCGSVSIMGMADGGASVTVVATLPSPGCKLGNNTVSGTITLDVSAASGMVSVGVGFMNVLVNGTTLSGMATFSTTNGTTFALVANITYGTSVFSTTGFTVTGAPGSITLDGALTTGTADAKTTLTFTMVVWKQGDCYPSAGTLRVDKGLLVETLTFSATTATTGQVTVKVGKKTSTQCLPSYGACTTTCAKDGG